MDRESLIKDHPTLFHMAEDGSWPSIQQRGLLSTQALVDLYQPDEKVRRSILGERRRDRIPLNSPGMPDAMVRDQKPLSQIARKLTPGTSLQSFLDALNGRVFFWLDKKRLLNLLQAGEYREQHHTVLHINTAALIAAYGDQITLCRLNSGTVNRESHPARGPEIFKSIEQFETHRIVAGGGRQPVKPVELTVRYAVRDISQYVESVNRWVPGHYDPKPVFTAAR